MLATDSNGRRNPSFVNIGLETRAAASPLSPVSPMSEQTAADFMPSTGSKAGSSSSSQVETPASTSGQTALTNFDPLEVIGSGSFGLIRKVRRKSDGKVLARKEIDYRKMSDREKRQLVSEVNILRELRHPHIVRYYERFVDRDNCLIYIIMEYCEGGDLSSVIKRCRRESRSIPEPVVWSLFTQLLLALCECHHPPPKRSGTPRAVVLHRDLKPDNVFLDAEQNIKLGDFGLSRVIDDPETQFARTYVGTPFYMSPELVNESEYNTKSDIWSLGCLVYEMCALEPPFQAKSQAGLAAKIKLGKTPEIPKGYSNDLRNVIKSMLQVNHAKRPTAAELLKHDRIQICLAHRDLGHAQAVVKRREEELLSKETELKAREREIATRERDLVAKERELAARERRLASVAQSYSMQYVPPSAEAPEAVPSTPTSESAVPTPSPSVSSFSTLIEEMRETASSSNGTGPEYSERVPSFAGVEPEAELDASGGAVGDAAWWLAKARGSALPRPRKPVEATRQSDDRRRITGHIPTMSPRMPPPPPSRKSPSRVAAPTSAYSNVVFPHAPSGPNHNPPRPHLHYGVRRRETQQIPPPSPTSPNAQTPQRPMSVAEPMSISSTPVDRENRRFSMVETPESGGSSNPAAFAARLQAAGGNRAFSGAAVATPVSMLARDMGRMGFGSPMQLDATPTKG
ncbi:G2-specific serine/threonine protein kinase [Gonapodya sp. JEL0774]|nr:G2-specific serine/threonine protein kinase [Gonapodya sp. JEL0774]